MSQPSSPSIVAPGILLAGKYRLIRELGEGAMGSVWSAVNESTQREVALKLITRPEPEFRLRLQREARALGALKHRNIIDIYDIEETDTGEPFLVMQLLTGETVGELLARKRRLDPMEASRIARDVARALSAAHAIPIIHRDLKPANIFLHRELDDEESDYLVKVLDFGVAKNLAVNDGMHTAAGGAVGSPLYMSPEQVRAQRDIDPRADIWTLGVVLFEMLTGVRPFDGDAGQVFGRILSGEIPRVDRYVRRVDPDLVELVSRCMRRERGERFQTAAELASALERFVEPGKISGSDWSRVGPPPTSQPGPASNPTSHPGPPGPASHPAAYRGSVPSLPAPGEVAGNARSGGSGQYPAYQSGGYPAYGSGGYPVAGPQSAPPVGPGPQSGRPPGAMGMGPQGGAMAAGDLLLDDDAATIPINPAMAKKVMAQIAQRPVPAGAQGPGAGQGIGPGQGMGAGQAVPGAWQQQQRGSGSWQQPSMDQAPYAPTVPAPGSGQWPAQPGPASVQPGPQSPARPPQASPEINAGGAAGWAQGGTVKMDTAAVEAYRQQAQAAQQQKISSTSNPAPGGGGVDPRMTAPLPPGGVVPGYGAAPANPYGSAPTNPQPAGAASTTTPLVSGAASRGVGPMDTMTAALVEDRRKRTRVVAAVAGVVLGLVVAITVMLVISSSENERPELTPEPAASGSALPTVAPSAAPSPEGKQEPPSTPAPTDSAQPSTPTGQTAAPDAPKPATTATAKPSSTTPASPSATAKPTTKKPPAPADPCAGKTGFLLTECRKRNGQQRPF